MSSPSSESDVSSSRRPYTRSRSRGKRQLPSVPSHSRRTSARVDNLTSTLQDTTRNLKAVDRMLDDYREVSQRQGSAIDRLRSDLTRTTDQLREERLRSATLTSQPTLRASDLEEGYEERRREPTTPLRDYRRSVSDTDYPTRRRRQRGRSTVRFLDDEDAADHLHELHQSLRDITSDQARLGEDMNREILRRNRSEAENRRAFSELSQSLRQQIAEPVGRNVDRKLDDLRSELRSERKYLDRRQEEVGQISSDLKQALEEQRILQKIQQQQQQQSRSPQRLRSSTSEESHLRGQLARAESQKTQIESELQDVRRRLDQSEGGRNALVQQVDELRTQLARADEERSFHKSQLELQQRESEERDRRKRKTLEEERERERRELEREIQDLRGQLSRSTGADEIDELRRTLGKSERQRQQLTDHLEVLTKDLESKDKNAAKLVNQLREASEKNDSLEKQKHQTLIQLEESLKKLRDVTQDAEQYQSDLWKSEQKLTESERKKEELKSRAQENIKFMAESRMLCRIFEMKSVKIEFELQDVRRRLDQSEGGRNALVQQVDELRTQLARADEERSFHKSQLELQQRESEERDRRKRKTLEEEKERERRELEREIQDLRGQLSRSTGADEIDELWRTLGKSERQRQQLTDHLEVLTKDLESKDKNTAKLVNQLREASEKNDSLEKQKHQTLIQLEESLKKLRDVTQDAEQYQSDLWKSEQKLTESERKKEELKSRAQENIKLWKAKCKRLEKEVEQQKSSAEQMSERNERLTKELEGTRSQANTGSNQVQNLRREMADILEIRAQQDEKLRLRDLEVEQLKGQNQELAQELREARHVIDRFEGELQSLQSRHSKVSEDNARLDQQLSSSQAAHMVAQDRIQELQQEVKDIDRQRIELGTQLAEESTQRQMLEERLAEFRHSEALARQEIDSLSRQIREEKESHIHLVEQLKGELEDCKSREMKTTQDLNRKIKRDQTEHEAEIQGLKISISEEKSQVKLAKRQEEKFKAELERLHEELVRLEEENAKVKRQYQRAKQEYESKAQTADEESIRVRRLEEELVQVKDISRKLERELEDLLHTMSTELDSLVDVASQDCVEKYRALSPVKQSTGGTSVHKWLAEWKSKIQWLRAEIRDRMDRERKMRREVKESLETSEADRRFFTSEIRKQRDVIDRLDSKNQNIAKKEREKAEIVSELEEKVLDLTDHLDDQREKELQTRLEMETLLDQMQGMKESDRERQRIHERYARLQGTLTSLRSELDEKPSSFHTKEKAAAAGTSKPRGSPRHTAKKRVRIETPPTRDMGISSQQYQRDTRELLVDERGDGEWSSTRQDVRKSLPQHSRSRRAFSPTRDSRAQDRTQIGTSHQRDRSPLPDTPLKQTDLISTDLGIRNGSRSMTGQEESTNAPRSKSPPPLALSDEDFLKKFVPKSPKLTDNDFEDYL
ncbi:centrosomal protein of 128 kDa [Lingula anatina]|uniref:Centrosomal protein of 128 kDa n=1 Tax=Lingula anatina TaxID=7574 RepID=A0A1S3JLV1_LINAN|nr:centrosomal protein of 128 kDa [Lingula anatina]|eukprot:XP_013411390.1 centrosomal protein of 128 kDa [Lingula anatina]